MPCQITGRRCDECNKRQANALSDLCGLCFAGATALRRVLDLFIYHSDLPIRVVRRVW